MGFGLKIIALFAALLLAHGANAQTGTMNVTVDVVQVPWTRIQFPHGVYEPYSSELEGIRLFTFNLTFWNLTAPPQSLLTCGIRRSDGSHIELSKPVESEEPSFVVLSHTLSQDEPINRDAPWLVLNCSLFTEGQMVFTTDSDYGNHLGKKILVHPNEWTRFSTADDDAYRASRCFLGIPGRYFNNTKWCHHAGDVGFAIAMSRGMEIGLDCVDCQSIYCQGIPHSCRDHDQAQDPFTGRCVNGLCWETKSVAGKDITYHYTRYVHPEGALKVRIEARGYSTSRPISYGMRGFNDIGAHGTYAPPGLHIPEKERVTGSGYFLEQTGGYAGDIDLVMYVTPKGTVNPGWNTFTLYLEHLGQELFIEHIPYYVSSQAPSNWDESESMPGIIDNPCADGLDNDLSYLVDCANSRCDREIGGLDCDGNLLARCEYLVEMTCHDCFDNNADGFADCDSRHCHGMIADPVNDSVICVWGRQTTDEPIDEIDDEAVPDGRFGCEDEECHGEFASPIWAIRCRIPETDCFDGFDNDGDGLIDCADPDCRGATGPGGVRCEPVENTAELCSDGFDNDGDGLIDCADPDCWGVGDCAPQAEAADPTFTVPHLTEFRRIGQTSISYSHLERMNADDSYIIYFNGSTGYKSVIITLGDATNNDPDFPFMADSCVLSGSNGLRWVATQSGVGQIQYDPSVVGPSSMLDGFIVRLICGGKNESGTWFYPITATSFAQANTLEYGELTVNSTVYEKTSPRILGFEPAPFVGGVVGVPYGSHFDIRAVPEADLYGVGQCHFRIDNMDFITGPRCVFRQYEAIQDGTLEVSAACEDGLGNIGSYSDPYQIPISVAPIFTDFSMNSIIFRDGMNLNILASAITSVGDSFTGGCKAVIEDEFSQDRREFDILGSQTDNKMVCEGNIPISGLKDGLYYVTLSATDSNADTAVSGTRYFYVCTDPQSSGDNFDCSLAEFESGTYINLCIIDSSRTTTTTTTTTTVLNFTRETALDMDCEKACETYYMTSAHACSFDSTCQDLWDDNLWVRDRLGDLNCLEKDDAAPYCCCLIEGVNLTDEIEPALQDPGTEEDKDPVSEVAESMMFIVDAPNYVSFNDIVNFRIVGEDGRGIIVGINIRKPDGTVISDETDIDGRYAVLSDQVGLWSITAAKEGFIRATAVWAVLPQMTPEVAVVTGSSILFPVLILLLIRAYGRKRSGTAAMEDAVLKLHSLGMIDSYAPIWVTEETHDALPQVRAYLEPVILSDKDIARADMLSIEMQVNIELAKLMLISKKKKAKKLITSSDMLVKQYNQTKIVTIWEEIEGSKS